MIAPCGFYKSKAQTIKLLIKWFEKYNFSVQQAQKTSLIDLRKELLLIKGIGTETADVILVYTLYQPSFIIDTYTRRFLSRLGFDFEDDEKIRIFFERNLPKYARIYGYFHWLILDHCILVCRKTPLCSKCKMNRLCGHFNDKTVGEQSSVLL